MDEAQVIDRLVALRADKGVIRQTSAIFDSAALGYRSALVAARCPAARLERAAAIISEHPGVSHNYQRDHAMNLWYTVAVGPDSKLGMDATIQRLHELSGCERTLALPTLKLFKIGVKFDLGAEGRKRAAAAGAGTARHNRAKVMGHVLTDQERRLVRVLQQDLSLVRRPFDAWADQARCRVGELLAAARTFQERGLMRRFSAVLHHRRAGVVANVMAVWRVEPEDAGRVGAKLAAFDAVSHCYLRQRYEDWPYNLYTMVHARSVPEAERTLEAMRQATGVSDCQLLWTVREFKKARLRYFTEQIRRWEARHGGGDVGAWAAVASGAIAGG